MVKPITILHLRASNFIGGPEKQILEQFSHLDVGRFRPLICCFRESGCDNPIQEQAQKMGIACRTVDARSAFDLRTIARLRRILIEEKVDLLCSHGYKPNIIGRIAAWLAGIPAIAISRGWTSENPRIRVYEKLDKFFLNFADKVVAVSHGQRDKILALGANADRVVVIHNAINLEKIPEAGWRQQLRQELGVPQDAFVVASAGRLSPEKNYGTLVEVARQAIQHNANIYFVIFGEGVLRGELERSIGAAGLCGHFLLPGFRKDLQELLHGIDVFMLPSLTEGLPNVVLEAFAVCKPVVATRVGGTPEVVQEGVSGFLTEPDEPELMARHILDLADNPNLCHRMGKAGYEYIQEHFSFESQTREYEQLYMNVLKMRNHLNI